MAKVLRIENRIVTIGNDDGTMDEYDIGYFNYEPHVNDEVKVYHDQDTLIIARSQSASEDAHMVHRNTYVLLAIFLGWIGVNEFYAGYTARGVISCIFFWSGIPWLVNLIKGVIVLTKKADENGNIRV